MNNITMKQRMQAFFQGEPLDRIPFVQVNNLAAPNEEIWSMIGRDKMGLTRWSSLHRFESVNCRMKSERLEDNGVKGIRNTIMTPLGTLFEDKYYDPGLGSEAYRKHFVEKEEDYPILIAYLRDLQVLENTENYLKDQYELGEDGLAMAVIYRTPFQKLWIELVSIEDLVMHMADNPDIVDECVEVLVSIQRKIFQIAIRAVETIPVPIINIPDNITAPIIGKNNFSKYCVPYYNELAEMIANKGTPIVVHMDGELKQISKEIGESHFNAIDSFTPTPDNSISVAHALDIWPDKKLMVNFPSSVHLESSGRIYDTAMQILNEGGHSGRIWMQISENVPKNLWKKSFPAIVKAIEDFGKP